MYYNVNNVRQTCKKISITGEFCTMAKRLLLILLVCVMALPLLVACNDTQPGTTSTPSQDGTSAGGDVSEDVSVDTNIYPDVIDLEGREINVLQWGWGMGSSSIKGFTGEIVYSDESDSNYSRVDVAKKEVVAYIESTYNCTIGEGYRMDTGNIMEEVQQMVTSGTYTYDIIFASSNQALNMLSNDLLTDLNTVPTFHFENSWWDQNAVNDLSIDGRLFRVCGDINTYDNLGTWCVLFNKKMKSDLGITDDFYQKARDGEWTMDYFMELCQGVTQDLNGDGLDEFDQWAVGTETFNIYAHLVGGGIRVAEKDPNTDLPYLTVSQGTERTYNALQKVLDFYNGGEVMVANGGKYNSYPNPWESTIIKAFEEGRELFYVCGLISIAGFRDMEDPLGILPMPKLYEEQDRYYHTVSPDNSSYLLLPYGVPGVEELGTVIEAMAMKSQEIVTPEFYEVQLKGRDARDNESEEMLDIIFGSRCFDLGVCYNWGSIMGCYYDINPDNIASRFDAVISNAEIAIEDTLEDLEGYDPILN